MQLRRLKLQLRKQAGDTIVEVLIATTVVSFVLAGAYASANHSLATIQDTQEHAQALKLVQTQVELLRANGGAPTTGSCFASDGSGGTASCDMNADGTPDTTGDQPDFKLSITKASGLVCDSDTYTVNATWPSIHGTDANVDICYRPAATP